MCRLGARTTERLGQLGSFRHSAENIATFRLRRYTEVLSPLAGSKGGNMQFELSAPRTITFAISLVLALIAAVAHYAHIGLPICRSGFTLLLVGYLVLAAGNVLRNV